MRLVSDRLYVYILILLGLLIYSNAISNGFVGDDIYQVVTNRAIHSLSNLPQFFTGSTYYNADPNSLMGAYYRPFMMTFYSFMYALAGPNPHLFHLMQIFLHIINAILLYFILKTFFKPILSFLLAIVFLIHPQNNEAVVYIANLQDTLFLFFGLLGLLQLTKKEQNLFLASFCFLLSLLSKETGIAFVFIGVLYQFFFNYTKRKQLLLGLLIIGLTYYILRVSIAHIGTTHTPLAPITLASSLERLATIPSIIVFYLQTFFFPVHISALHFWVVKQLTFQTFYLPLLLVLGFFSFIIGVAYKLIKQHHPLTKPFLFFSLWMLSGMTLHLHLIATLDATAADRWFYFPFIGMLGILGVCIEAKLLKLPKLTIIIWGLMIIILIALGIRTYIRNNNWKDTITLYEHDMKYSQSNFLITNALGTEYIKDGDFEKAKPFIMASVAEYPYFANLNNAAIIALHEGNIGQARKYLQQAITQSNHYLVYENYSSFLIKYGPSKEEAKSFTQKAILQFPQSEKLKENLKFIQ